LFLLHFSDKVLDRLNQLREYQITYRYEEKPHHKYERSPPSIMELRIVSSIYNKSGNTIKGKWRVTAAKKKHHAFIEHILADESVLT